MYSASDFPSVRWIVAVFAVAAAVALGAAFGLGYWLG